MLRTHDGKPIVLAVSPAGLVQIADDGPAGTRCSARTAKADAT